MKNMGKIWVALAVLALLCPLGLMIPNFFKTGSAWGEWERGEIQKLVGYVPQGFQKLSEFWKAPFPDYALRGWGEKGLGHLSMAYLFSAFLGAGLVALVAWAVGHFLSNRVNKK